MRVTSLLRSALYRVQSIEGGLDRTLNPNEAPIHSIKDVHSSTLVPLHGRNHGDVALALWEPARGHAATENHYSLHRGQFAINIARRAWKSKRIQIIDMRANRVEPITATLIQLCHATA